MAFLKLLLKIGKYNMTSQQTDYAHNALVALMNIARATGQDYPNLAAHALNEAVEIGTWLINQVDPPVESK